MLIMRSGKKEIQGDFTVAGDSTLSGDLTQADVNRNEDNIMLNAFRIAVNGSLTQYNMVDGIVDQTGGEVQSQVVERPPFDAYPVPHVL